MARSIHAPEFFDDIIEDGYHIFSLTHAKTTGFYPNQFPEYPGVKLGSIVVGDRITIRAFFVLALVNPFGLMAAISTLRLN